MTNKTRIGVIIAAGGSGSRIESDAAKQWRTLGSHSLVEHAWRSFSDQSLSLAGQRYTVESITVAVDADHVASAQNEFSSRQPHSTIVQGGATRTESVQRALNAIQDKVTLVAVHDAARPFWPQSRWDGLIEATQTADGAILAIPVADTIKRSYSDECITVDRDNLWMAQTPQVFRADILRKAHERAMNDQSSGTDDAELVERVGGKIKIVQSDARNFKITTSADWQLAESLIAGQTSNIPSVGIGYDAHKLGGDCPLIIGGVILAATGGLIGHSDGDVLLHAVCDALLGAAALGDIGVHFPPSDPTLKGVDSRDLLRRTREILQQSGRTPYQVDAVIMAESPRMAPHIDSMRDNIASDLDIPRDRVSVKATTTEKMGFIGRGEGIAAQAVATILNVGQ